MKKRVLQCTGYGIAVVCLLYFVVLLITIGPAFRFSFVWLAFGLFFLGISLVLTFSKKGFQWMPKPVLVLVEAVVVCGCLVFVVIEGLIIAESVKQPQNEADYLIVLGAKVNGTTPSLILQYRINKAAEYMKKHPGMKAIVSGGQGADEGISEAEAMKNGLLSSGIAAERILVEDQSTSTKENLDYSQKLLTEAGGSVKESKVIVVTTDFHVLRAVGIARKAGYEQVEGLAAKSVWYLIPTNYVREFMAVVKDKLIANM
ncbi:MAG: YdcF family protein [Lachnospiraceae bacterium]|nr:YdcF family protein [Lachnospiraceae bacterium]